MSTFTVPIVTVKSVTKHPNADALDLVEFEEVGWRCVDKIGLRKPGDLVVYIPIDSVVNVNRPEFAFLTPRAKADGSCRIRTIRLRGEISQGLIVDLPPFIEHCSECGSPLARSNAIEGHTSIYECIHCGHPNGPLAQDVSDMSCYFDIHKYEPPEEHLPPMNAGSFPSWCPKSDAERYQNFNRAIEPYKDKFFYVTMKLDGMSCTVFYDADRPDNPIGVCSRNWEVKEADIGANKWVEKPERPEGGTNVYWSAVRKAGILDNIERIADECGIRKFAIQGEICGPGIQKNKMGLSDIRFYAFDIYDGDKQDYFEYKRFIALCYDEEIETVPILAGYEGPVSLYIDEKFEFVSKLRYPNGTPAEGAVFVCEENIYVGTLGRLKFKYINPLFLLKYEE